MGLAHQSLVSPCRSFFPFLSFSLSVLLSGWLLGTQELYWLSVLIKEDQASLFALLSFRLSRHPEGMRVWAMIRLACHGSSTWPCHGWDLPWWLPAMGIWFSPKDRWQWQASETSLEYFINNTIKLYNKELSGK